MAKTRDALKILDRIGGADPELREMIEEETVNAQVARMIYDARTEAGLSQQQLANLVGTRQSVIARLESTNYEGHSLSMLKRIAKALGQHLTVQMTPDPSRKAQLTV